jgi:hypothetical protein
VSALAQMIPTGLQVVSEVATCKYCGSPNLKRNGWYSSKNDCERTGERHQIVRCGDCRKYSNLPAGAMLAKPRAIATGEATAEARRRRVDSRIAAYDPNVSEVRPTCPRCGGSKIQRHRKINYRKRCWGCVDCRRSFIADDIPALVDHRRVSHFHEISAEDEATFLFHYALRNGTTARVREEIGISEKEKSDLDFLVADGVLPRAEVSDAIWFRSQVLQIFDGLVHAREREMQSLADAGMLANAEGVLRSRDRAMEPFTNLLDAELSVLAEREQSLRDHSNLAVARRENRERGEADADVDANVDVESASLTTRSLKAEE